MENYSFSDDYSAVRYSTDDGLPIEEIYAIEQTIDGFIWIGTPLGLSRFDGLDFDHYNQFNTPVMASSQSCHALAADERGGLWIGTGDGLLMLEPGKGFRRYTTEDGLPGNLIRQLFPIEGGGVWIRSIGGLSRLKDGKIEVIPFESVIHAMTVDAEGNVWICLRPWDAVDGKSRLYRLSPGDSSPKLWPTSSDIRNVIDCLHVDDSGDLLLGGRSGIFHVNKDRKSSKLAEFAEATADYAYSVSSIFKLNKESILYSQANGFLFSLHPQTHQITAIEPGFQTREVTCHLEAEDGAQWLGTRDFGLVKLNRHGVSFVRPNANEGLDKSNVHCVMPGPGNSIWMGTANGLALLEGEDFTFVDNETSTMLVTSVYSLCQDHRGGIWYGGPGGLEIYDNERVFSFGTDTPDLLPFDVHRPNCKILFIMESRNQRLWIGTDRGLFSCSLREDENTILLKPVGRGGECIIENMAEINLIPDMKLTIQCIAEGDSGSMWIGTEENGLVRWSKDSNSVLNYGRAEGLTSQNVRALYWDEKEQDLWIGSLGGLFRFKDNRFTRLTTENGLHENIINCILDDGVGGIWLTGYKGIYRSDKESLGQYMDGILDRVAPIRLDRQEGMKSTQTPGGMQPTGCKLDDGRLCFATTRGCAIIDPKNWETRSETKPKLVIERVSANLETKWLRYPKSLPINPLRQSEESVPSKPIWLLPPGSGEVLEFEFASNVFKSARRTSYVAKLEGDDSKPPQTGSINRATYTNLEPGDYTFSVFATSSDGILSDASEASVFHFRILPYFFQTFWFRAVVAGALGLSVWGLYSLRLRLRLQKERMEYELKQLRERERLSRDMHDDLGSGLNRILLLGNKIQSEEKPDVIRDVVSKIRETARCLTRNIGDIVWATEPAQDAVEHLAAYLRSQAMEQFDGHGIDLRFEASGQIDDRPLTAHQRRNLFLIMREALNNARKHAKASKVEVRFEAGPSELTLQIRDNGEGFDPKQERPGHYGLRNMRNRARQIQGELSIQSSPIKGTILCVQVPIDPSDSQ